MCRGGRGMCWMRCWATEDITESSLSTWHMTTGTTSTHRDKLRLEHGGVYQLLRCMAAANNRIVGYCALPRLR
jgi:hypothetical protein